VLDITVIPGIEITHVPPALIFETAQKARQLGAAIIVVHGETIAEPVAPGTNAAALASDIDILAHPGLISSKEVQLAQEKNICLEISARKGHSLANGHVARLAKAHNAKLILNTDTHSPNDLINLTTARNVALGAGLSEDDFTAMQENSRRLVKAAGY
jgi:histidinol phosphatase-like PHP family hydrolase